MNLIENRIIRRVVSGAISVASVITTAAIPASSRASEVQPAPITDTQHQGNQDFKARYAIFVSGYNSSLSVQEANSANDPDSMLNDFSFGPVLQRIKENPTNNLFIGPTIRYSYAGSTTTSFDDGRANYQPRPYEAGQTHQDIDISVNELKDLIEQRKDRQNIPLYGNGSVIAYASGEHYDLVGYSLGALVIWKYLMENVLPEEGIHKNGVILRVLLLAPPLNGVPHETTTTWAQSAGAIQFQTDASNPVTQYISALGSDPEKRAFTTATNTQAANFLRERRNLRLAIMTNRDDCWIPPESANIQGFTLFLNLGRGPNGILNCDTLSLLSVPFLPGRQDENVGHRQILTNALVEVGNFIG